MLYLFLGKDTFSKQQRLRHLGQIMKADVSRISSDAGVLNWAQLTEPTLFGGPRIFVLENLISQLDPDTDILHLSQSGHTSVLWEDSLDKRKKTTTQWLKHPDIKVEEFDPPQGPQLQQWVTQRAKELGASFDKAAADYFLSVILPPPSASRFAEPSVDLWQIDSELRKVAAYAGGKPIDKTAVDAVATKNSEVEAWDITNALADRDLNRAFLALEQFYSDDSLDDKAKTIQLNALLADQFRNILLVQDFTRRRVPDPAILEQTAWKSGRLFIMKKLAGKFRPEQLLPILDKLERLDVELKTTTTPGQTILQLILAQLA
jgi:DNA polymerase III delta subunit